MLTFPRIVKRYSFDELRKLPALCTSVDGVTLALETRNNLQYWLHANGHCEVYAFMNDKWQHFYSYDSMTVRQKEYELVEKFFPSKKVTRKPSIR